jgi:hypothetical protein
VGDRRSAEPQGEELRLASLGIHVADEEQDPGVRAECARIARSLIARGVRVIGLVPMKRNVAIPPLAVQLGLALCDLSGAPCAVVDANVHLPALSRIIEENPQREDDESFFATRWLHKSLALLTPPHAKEAGTGLPELSRLVKHGRELFAHMLCDLTGFDGLGEHLGAMDLVEGVLLVAPATKIREKDILRWTREVPAARRLGVLLQGPRNDHDR